MKKIYYVIFFYHENVFFVFWNESCRFDLIPGSFLGDVILQHNLTSTLGFDALWHVSVNLDEQDVAVPQIIYRSDIYGNKPKWEK